MTEHYCTVHNCKFYRNEKEGRVWYSHKIKDGSGYCNEPKEAQPSEPTTSTTVAVPGVEIPHDTHTSKTPAPPHLDKPTPPKHEISPQERGMWWKEVGENFRAKLFNKDDNTAGTLLWRAYTKQMLSSLEIVITKSKEQEETN